MKKWIKIAGLLLLTLPVAVQAVDYTYTTNGGAITITGYTGTNATVAIPDTINGLPVTGIGEDAFAHCTSLTSVTIPGSVTSIGDEAFRYCSGLTNATISTNVTSIGSYAFAQCTSLTSVTIPNSVTNIGGGAFNTCLGLTSIAIPNSVTSIGGFAFSGCTSLTNALIGNSVTSIGDGAFVVCTNLLVITVDGANPSYSSVAGVLFNKTKTTLIQYPGGKAGSYTVPAGVTNIGFAPFVNCPGLSAIAVDTNNPAYSSTGGVLFNKNQTALIAYPGGKAGSCTIPGSVTNIGFVAFAFCPKLTGITIPNSVTGIGGFAFMHCTSLTNVTIPASVTGIGDGAFLECTSLLAITVDTNNSFYSSMDGAVFNKTKTLLVQCPGGKTGSYTVPASVTGIGNFAFSGCTNLTNITIPAGVTSIGDSAFEDCFSLAGVYFKGDAPASVGSFVFSDASNVTVYYLPETTGWSPWFDWRPTVLWNPKVQIGDGSFGVRTNRFGFNITGTNNYIVVVEASTNLISGIWVPVKTNTLTGGSVYFYDSQSTNYPARFYRLRMP